MEFTANSVHQNWVTLNTSTNAMVRTTADKYLTAFKSAPNFLPVCSELFSFSDPHTRLFTSLALYTHLRQHISSIKEKKETFLNYKTFFLSNIYQKISLTTPEEQKISMNICSAITIIVLVGKATFWPESIENVIEMSKTSEQNFIFASMILGNINHELDSMLISKRDKEIIINFLRSYDTLITQFITQILFDTEKVKKEILYKNCLNILLSFANCGVNFIGVDERIPVTLVSSLVSFSNLRDLISEVVTEMIANSSSSKLYTKINIKIDNYIPDLMNKCDKKEMHCILEIAKMINNLYLHYLNKPSFTEEEKDIIFHSASIFASLMKNYIFLLFLSNPEEIKFQSIFSFFIGSSTRRTSLLLFDSITEMKDFIDGGYHLSDMGEEAKQNFLYFLFSLSELIMNNTKLKSLSVNFELISKNQSQNLSNTDIYSILADEEEIEISDESAIQYRKNAEEAFNDIFICIMYNYGEKGIALFLGKLGELLVKNTNSSKSINDISNEYLTLVEAELFTVQSLSSIFDLPNMSPQMLLNFSNFILNSQLLSNEKILVRFILFLNSISHHISNDKNLYYGSINLLLNVAGKCEPLCKATTLVLVDIISAAKPNEMNKAVGSLCADFFTKHCNDIDYISIGNVVEGALKADSDSLGRIIEVLKGAVTKTCDYKKIFEINNKILKVLSKSNLDALFNLYKDPGGLNFIFDFSSGLINNCYNETEEMNTLLLFFMRFCLAFKERCALFFDIINDIIFSLYAKNPSLFNAVLLMKFFYGAILSHNTINTEKNNLIEAKFFIICSQIKTNIYSLQSNEVISETIAAFAQFFAVMIDKIKHFDFNQNNLNILNETFTLFIESSQSLVMNDLNIDIVKAFLNFYNNPNVNDQIKNGFSKGVLISVFSTLENFSYKGKKVIAMLMSKIFNLSREVFQEVINKEKYGTMIFEYFILFADKNDKIEQLISDLIMIRKESLPNEEVVIKKYMLEIRQMQMLYNKLNKKNGEMQNTNIII